MNAPVEPIRRGAWRRGGAVAALLLAATALAAALDPWVSLATCAAVAEKEGLTGDGYRVIFNTGRFGGQEVFHVHGHVVGGRPLGPMLSA